MSRPTNGPGMILVRHGQTNSNLSLALDTVPPGPPLNATGLAQAHDVAAKLATEPVAAVYASTATRAGQTAAAIAARHGLEVETIEGVHEVFCGDYEGRSDREARQTFEDVFAGWAAGDLARRLPGGESAAELADRFLPAITRLWRRHADRPDQSFVLVSHGGTIRLGAGLLMGRASEGTEYLPNAGRVMLAPLPTAPAPGGWHLNFWEKGTPLQADPTGGAD